jgi:hypothetical protein
VKRNSHQPAGPGAARLDITVPDQDDPPGDVEWVRWLSQLQADLSESINGVALRAARPVSVGTGGGPRPLSSPGRIVGWSLKETTGAAGAYLRIWDGREAGGGQLLACISVAQGITTNHSTPGGINVSDAVYVEVVSGAVEGVIYLGGVD